nr:hypothetical protein Iba_chr12cCG0450 [Ipomoea batatas]GME17207.1 hypothetical protein Iba_scaffold18403CG0710 [Ipomoea batatas]
MKNFRLKSNLWRFEWIIRGEMNSNQKHSPSIWAIWGTHYGCLPVKHVLTNRSCAARGRRIFLEILELLQDPFRSHRSEETPRIK